MGRETKDRGTGERVATVEANEMDDRIERYLTGRMSPEAVERFEVQLLSDPELLAETRAAEALQQGMRALEGGGQAIDDPHVGRMAVAAVVALGISVVLLLDAGPVDESGAVGGSAMVAELSLTRGGAGPVIHMPEGASRLELRLVVPGVDLAELPWTLDGTSVGGTVAAGGESGSASVELDAASLSDGDHRIVVIGTAAGDLIFEFTTTH